MTEVGMVMLTGEVTVEDDSVVGKGGTKYCANPSDGGSHECVDVGAMLLKNANVAGISKARRMQ